MRILLTNDDGIEAPGLAALHVVARELGDVTVVAPAEHQSGASHAITLGELPVSRVRVDRHDAFEGLAVQGKPADCVRLAILELLDERPDLVLSGINAGANSGLHVYYSGTVGAAAEAAMLCVPAVAFSTQFDDKPPDFRRSIDICRKVLRRLLDEGLKDNDLVNVNIPVRAKPKGIRIVPQSMAMLDDGYRLDERGVYVLQHSGFKAVRAGTDRAELLKGYVTITPLHVDMTDHDKLQRWRGDHWDDLLESP